MIHQVLVALHYKDYIVTCDTSEQMKKGDRVHIEYKDIPQEDQEYVKREVDHVIDAWIKCALEAKGEYTITN